ncbi:Transcriptional regulator, AcrR family [hydrothermal vent metagenome]|uniref:Transcriptional regulator, AcrR family n=1 Tax=hydrothermal vent metagenome TaxID=652676 RepID=A0A3B0XDK7_9ZZZZ
MGTKGEGNRQRIIDAADNLFYRRGYNQTSFQDISDATGIPRGNFYYYFKTKDEILDAVVTSRVADLSSMLKQCETETNDARERLLMFSNMLEYKRDDVIKSGCPIGSLCSELAKDEIELHDISQQAFVLLNDWLKKQFRSLGLVNASDLAMDLLAKLQGVSVLACAFKDVAFVKRSHGEIKDWINAKALN